MCTPCGLLPTDPYSHWVKRCLLLNYQSCQWVYSIDLLVCVIQYKCMAAWHQREEQQLWKTGTQCVHSPHAQLNPPPPPPTHIHTTHSISLAFSLASHTHPSTTQSLDHDFTPTFALFHFHLFFMSTSYTYVYKHTSNYFLQSFS